MEVSVWWVVGALLVGVWTGFLLCAVMTMAREPRANGLYDADGLETNG